MKIRSFFIHILYICNGSACSFSFRSDTYEVLKGIKLSKTYYTFLSYHNSTNTCALYCLADIACVSAKYNLVTTQCELNSKSPLDESANIEEDNEWRVLYSKEGMYKK